MEKRFTLIGAVLSLFLICITPGNAGLDSYSIQIIKLAFMNGYVRAIETDLEIVKSLKNNRELLRKISNNQTDRYIEEVVALNRPKTEERLQVRAGGSYKK